MIATKTPRWPRVAILALLLTLLSSPVLAQVEAFVGEPFGVGQINVNLPKEALPEVLGAGGLGLSDAEGRVFYPAVKSPPDSSFVTDLLLRSPLMSGGPVRREAGGLLQELLKQPPRITLYFLFQGDKPLDIMLAARQPRKFLVRPRRDPQGHTRLLQAWWRQYSTESKGLFAKKNDYPPVVDNYLKSMLARRLNLALPDEAGVKSKYAELEEQLGLFLGTEQVRTTLARRRMLAPAETLAPASLPLPESPAWPPLELPEVDAKTKTEPIAARVPAECLYVRFGSYANFLWMQDTLAKWGGDLSNLVALRGLDRGMSERMEEQLVLKQTVMGRMLGGTVISDVAMIGSDMFMREGGAFGLLFEARNTFLLAQDFTSQRTERLAKKDGTTEEKIKIAGKTVSYLSKPDGSVRSYFLADGGYLFVTTSKTLMERFIETGQGKDSLGKSAEFLHARCVMPIDRDDSVFVYLSDAFFRNMASPRYWIEMARRLEAAADIELAQMASLVSATEGGSGDTISELIAGKLLPSDFGPRPDGSAVVFENNEFRDSVRGHRGRFVPIPDVPVNKVTPAEAAAYQRFTEFYQAKWGRLDPMIVGIKRTGLPNNQDRVVLDIHANPFAKRHVEMLSQSIGLAEKTQLAPIPGDLVAGDVQLTKQRLFGGLRDVGLPFNIVEGRFVPAGGLFNMFVGYIGTTGELGFLSLLDVGVANPPDAEGMAGRESGLWKYRNDQFTVFSLQRDVLATVRPQLRFEPAKRAAQIRLRVGDVSSARLTPVLNTFGYLRTRDTSLGNLRLMHAIEQQIRVPGPDCRDAAELLLDAKLICPLGGKYEYKQTPDGLGHWTSTALDAAGGGGFLDVKVPEGYQAPPLNWFRGLDMDATMTDKDLSAHVEIIMQMPSGKQ